jgi:flagellar motor switch protein FliN/FliY
MADKSSSAEKEQEPEVVGATVTELKPHGTNASEGEHGQGAAPAVAKSNPRNLDLIMDIPLKVTVELGRTKMVVHDLLALGQGSVIELAKLAGEPMEVLVNDKLVARGEAVVVNEKFGVRLTDIISPMERIQQLK